MLKGAEEILPSKQKTVDEKTHVDKDNFDKAGDYDLQLIYFCLAFIFSWICGYGVGLIPPAVAHIVWHILFCHFASVH